MVFVSVVVAECRLSDLLSSYDEWMLLVAVGCFGVESYRRRLAGRVSSRRRRRNWLSDGWMNVEVEVGECRLYEIQTLVIPSPMTATD